MARFQYKSLVEDRINGAGYVYSRDRQSRLGFSPLSTVTHDPEHKDQLAVWQTDWGPPSRDDIREMMHALQLYFGPDKLIRST